MSIIKPRLNKEKLVELLLKTNSQYDSEVIVAIREANKVLFDANFSWSDIFKADEKKHQKQKRQDSFVQTRTGNFFNYITKATVFKNKYGTWSIVENDNFYDEVFSTADEAMNFYNEQQ